MITLEHAKPIVSTLRKKETKPPLQRKKICSNCKTNFHQLTKDPDNIESILWKPGENKKVVVNRHISHFMKDGENVRLSQSH